MELELAGFGVYCVLKWVTGPERDGRSAETRRPLMEREAMSQGSVRSPPSVRGFISTWKHQADGPPSIPVSFRRSQLFECPPLMLTINNLALYPQIMQY